MDKIEYVQLKEAIVKRLGPPEFDYDQTPLNESAKELAKVLSAYKSSRMMGKKIRTEGNLKSKPVLNESEQKEIVTRYKTSFAVPIELSDNDLTAFNQKEREVLTDYFRNTNLTPKELEREGFSRQKVVALFRSGPFAVLASRVFECQMSIEVRTACLKAVREGDKRILERFAEQTGVLRNQEMNLNINKPIQDEVLAAKLKELGDAI